MLLKKEILIEKESEKDQNLFNYDRFIVPISVIGIKLRQTIIK